jgi:hypothetical protein
VNYEELNRVLKYSHDDVHNLMTQLASPEHNHTRWGGEQADHTFRGVLADALQESGRETEAGLLRTPDQHVVVHEGKVRAGKFTPQHLEDRLQDAENWIRDNGDDAMFPSLHILTNGTRHTFRSVDMDDPEGYEQRIPKGHLRVVTADTTGVHSHTHSDPHYSEMGQHLANEVEQSVNAFGDIDWGDYDWRQLDHHLDRVRYAPYEEVDTDHPSEQR